jgi:hypothetical protein
MWAMLCLSLTPNERFWRYTMSHIHKFKTSLIPALVAAVSVLGATSGPASAKQCIYMHGWFVLKITWLRVENGSVARVDKLFKNNQSCTDNNTYFAVLSIDGAKFADLFFNGAETVGKQLIGQIPTIGPVLQGLANNTLPGIPPSNETFYKGVPSSDQYLDVSGTIWDPRTGGGGPIRD